MVKPACPGCRERDERIARLEQQLGQLTDEVHELRARLGQNASNSSLPPSANPLQAPPPVRKTPTGRRPGGQPGHPGHSRLRLPPERLQAVIQFVPSVCARCQKPLPAKPGVDDPEPVWHQVAELPAQVAEVTEYQAHGRSCRACGHVTWETIPEAIRRDGFGPRLSAAVS
jgi:transposase